jgi:hypothetical protein
VILEQNVPPRDATRFAQEQPRIVRVVQHIHKHHRVEAAIVRGNVRAIEWFDRNGRPLAYEDIDAPHFHVRSLVTDQLRERTIATADIQHRGFARQQLSQVSGQDLHPPS